MKKFLFSLILILSVCLIGCGQSSSETKIPNKSLSEYEVLFNKGGLKITNLKVSGNILNNTDGVHLEVSVENTSEKNIRIDVTNGFMNGYNKEVTIGPNSFSNFEEDVAKQTDNGIILYAGKTAECLIYVIGTDIYNGNAYDAKFTINAYTENDELIHSETISGLYKGYPEEFSPAENSWNLIRENENYIIKANVSKGMHGDRELGFFIENKTNEDFNLREEFTVFINNEEFELESTYRLGEANTRCIEFVRIIEVNKWSGKDQNSNRFLYYFYENGLQSVVLKEISTGKEYPLFSETE